MICAVPNCQGAGATTRLSDGGVLTHMRKHARRWHIELGPRSLFDSLPSSVISISSMLQSMVSGRLLWRFPSCLSLDLDFYDDWVRRGWLNRPSGVYLGRRLQRMNALGFLRVGMQALTGLLDKFHMDDQHLDHPIMPGIFYGTPADSSQDSNMDMKKSSLPTEHEDFDLYRQISGTQSSCGPSLPNSFLSAGRSTHDRCSSYLF